MTEHVGIVGFGEAGASIAAGLVSEGAAVTVFDVRFGHPDGQHLRRGAEEIGVVVAKDVAQVCVDAPSVLSLVTARAAEPVASSVARHVTSEHLVADLNSTSPELAGRIGELIVAAGAMFADVAIMAAVPPNGHRVPMLASGPGAARFADLPIGMSVEVISDQIGAASAVKMLRSLLVKGLEALLLDTCLAARRFGATQRVLESMSGSLPLDDWEELATYLLGRTAVHGERRGHELEEVAAMLRDLDIDPAVPEAGARRLLWAASHDLVRRMGQEPVTHYDQVLSALEEGDR